ncbi:Ig-like domain-containing protein [Synoicihabitans lomoniglobus]|uniref:Ig-like domain-containing protein n=1 Tax=Synoicihabitans lomoniglobus TaxID=2909285 RepID=A0AAF0CPM1_9BACT|nr:Ig-like domain-containing protein [Opitutaceae bacterium LMO-M01]WED65464.1 Ig-like domain-containing protein [Opitutaceae bacterium LMO-M01]
MTQSDTLSVSVVGNTAPSVSLTSPGAGSTVLLGSSTALTASASDSDGTVAAVSFYANGVLIGTDAEAPYTMNWTPSAAGIYRLQVSASDSGSQTTTSTQVVVAVVDAAEVETDTVYSGTYIAGFEIGQFTIVRRGTVSATFIGKSNGANPTIYVYKDIAVDSAGNFSLVQSGQTVISGTFSDAGVNGQFDNNRAILIGVASFPSLTYTGPNGVIYGSLFSQNDSELLMIAAPDGKLTVLASSGGNRTVGFGAFGANNTFTVSTSDGGTITGTLDATTGFVQGFARGGAVSGTIRAALSSPAPAADGFLRNLSTRGYVGTGESILVAGFVVNGATPKQVLVRAIGPTLANYGVSGVVTDPTLKVYSGATVVASNDNWGTDAAVPGATATIGAFALPTGSADSALVTTLNPGPYTAQVSGVSGATGVGLVEIYDLDTQTPFSDDKMLNVATRGRVGAGDQALIAGVIVNGTTPKRVLIRAVGPTLSEFGIAGPLANPVLELVRQSDGSTVRQNDNWQRGNDAAGVVQASSEVGAFALPSGSLDAVLLITLPPGNYTALVTSGDNSSGIAIVEVYEVQ